MKIKLFNHSTISCNFMKAYTSSSDEQLFLRNEKTVETVDKVL